MKNFISLIGALLAGLTLSQAPEYTQQYMQRLAGAVDELRVIAMRFDTEAAQFGLTRQEGLERYQQSPDAFLARRGISMQATFNRYEILSGQLVELRNSDPLARLYFLARHFDSDIGTAAWEDFQPAIPLSINGALHLLAGSIAGYTIFLAVLSAAAALFRLLRSRYA